MRGSIHKMETSILGNRVRMERTRLGISQAELSRIVDCDQSFLSRIERGVSQGTPELLSALARALKVSISYLLGEDMTESREAYEATSPARKILKSTKSPVGLKELATDTRLVDALQIQDWEWEALQSLKLPKEVSKDGYVQLLITIRAITKH